MRKEDVEKEFVFVEKPWGNFKRFVHNKNCTVKIITVAPGGVLSLQSHNYRDELWVALDDGLRVELDGKTFPIARGDEAFVPRGSRHRLSSDVGGRILEISFGNFDEEDIVRYEDKYGRS
jgi:mannose-6-phosphate isomerase-like protein (cupin superfamily)